MNRSPLQLKHYHFISLALSASQDYDAANQTAAGPYPSFDNIQLHPEVTLFSNSDDDECEPYLVRLSINYKPENGEFPYSFDAVIEGIFEIIESAGIEDCKKTVVINGASMLYSAAREQLMALSSRHIHGPMLLPSLDFRHLNF
jgi:preprotein translocase subunit SecB